MPSIRLFTLTHYECLDFSNARTLGNVRSVSRGLRKSVKNVNGKAASVLNVSTRQRRVIFIINTVLCNLPVVICLFNPATRRIRLLQYSDTAVAWGVEVGVNKRLTTSRRRHVRMTCRKEINSNADINCVLKEMSVLQRY
jgi:hypothetical protein